jgi:hypothetical protein
MGRVARPMTHENPRLCVSESLSVSAFAQQVTADSDCDTDSDSERLGYHAILGTGERS